MRLFVSAIICLFITACASLRPAPPPPPPAIAHGSEFITPSRAVVIRKFIAGTEEAFSNQTGTEMKAVVLLTQQNSGRNKKVCEAFVRLPTSQAATFAVPEVKQIPSFWLLNATMAETSDCEKLLTNYNYGAARALLQVFGRADAKGPILLVADNGIGAAQRFVFVDLTKASGSQISKMVPGWFGFMEKNGLQGVTLKQKSIGSVLGSLICNTGQQLKADFVPQGADAEQPATFGYDSTTKKWTKPSLFSLGAILFGGPFVDAGCDLLGVTTLTAPQPRDVRSRLGAS